MKKQVLSLLTAAVLTLGVTGCKKEAKKVEDKVEKTAETVEKAVENAVADTKYKVIPAESSISWKANKVAESHTGTIGVSNGVAKFNGTQLVGGNFIFDINSLKVTDVKDAKSNAKLVKHLLSPDFFNAGTHSTALFQVTNVEGKQVTGDLTLNGIKKSISFPIAVATNGDTITILSDMFTIDRTEFGIKYNSDKIMDIKKLGDKLIKNDVEIKINVKAQKA